MSYTIHHKKHGILIEGPIPLSDMGGICKMGHDNDYDIVDAAISGHLTGVTMVLVNAESGNAWRAELGLEGKGLLKTPKKTDPLDELDVSEEAKEILRGIKVEVEDAYKDRIASLEMENARLREEVRLWDIDRKEVVTRIDTPNGPKHIVAALFDYASRAEAEGNGTTDFEGHIFARSAAKYIQWLEDELHRYRGVPDEMCNDWDEKQARWLGDNSVPRSFSPNEVRTRADELRTALVLTLKVLDANRTWKVTAEREATRLGQWNLKLRAAIEHVLQDGDDAVLSDALAAKPDYDDTRTAHLEGAAVTALERLNTVLNKIRSETGDTRETLLEVDALIESCLPLLFDGVTTSA